MSLTCCFKSQKVGGVVGYEGGHVQGRILRGARLLLLQDLKVLDHLELIS
jgi:hypothetical protein